MHAHRTNWTNPPFTLISSTDIRFHRAPELCAQSAPNPSYVRCIGHSWNCYDPAILNQSKRMSYREGANSLCADTNTHVRNVNLHQQDPHASVDPHILHFALGSKPWRSPPTSAYYNAAWYTYRHEMQSALLNDSHPMNHG